MAGGSPKHHVDRLGYRLGDCSGNPALAPEERIGNEARDTAMECEIDVEGPGSRGGCGGSIGLKICLVRLATIKTGRFMRSNSAILLFTCAIALSAPVAGAESN
jgi:hypothetical protein